MGKFSPYEAIGLEIGRRIRQVRGRDARIRVQELTDVHPNTLANYEAGRTPDARFIVSFCEAYGVSERWLLTGKGEMKTEPTHPLEGHTVPDVVEDMRGLVSVPFYDARVSAGAEAAEHIRGRLVIARSWLRTMGINPSSAQLLMTTGDSMLPTIEDGDVVMFETNDEPVRDGIYIIRRDSDPLVKRLQRRLDGSVTLISDNRLYPEEVLTALDARGLSVIGQVRMVFKKV